MHEYHTTQELLDHTLEQARNSEAVEIAVVHVCIGELSSYTEESIRFYWDQLSQGTPAEGAALQFRTEKGGYYCGHCDTSVHSREILASCPLCGSASLAVTSGDSVYLEALDIVPIEERSLSLDR